MASHSLLFYGLSTCIHCRHTREFLEENMVPFELVYVDKLSGTARDETIESVRKYNPQISFPTLVLDQGKQVIVGFQPQALRKALEI